MPHADLEDGTSEDEALASEDDDDELPDGEDKEVHGTMEDDMRYAHPAGAR